MDTSNAILTAKDVYILLSGIVIGVSPSLIGFLLNYKKTSIEIHQTETQSELNRVTVRSTELRDELATGEGVSQMLSTLIETGDKLRELQQQVFELKGRTMRAEADAQAAQMFVEQMHAAAKLKGVHLANYTPKQLKEIMSKDREH